GVNALAAKGRQSTLIVLALAVAWNIGLFRRDAVAHRRTVKRLRCVADVVSESSRCSDELVGIGGSKFFHSLEMLPGSERQNADVKNIDGFGERVEIGVPVRRCQKIGIRNARLRQGR